jgi:hypothetical protein
MLISRFDSVETSLIIEILVDRARSARPIHLMLPFSAFIAFIVVFKLTLGTSMAVCNSFIIQIIVLSFFAVVTRVVVFIFILRTWMAIIIIE